MIFNGLTDIYRYLFGEVYSFAGKMRNVNIAKGNFRFVPAIYLEDALNKIDNMPQNSFDNIIKKYIEMNVAHPFIDENESLVKNKLVFSN